MSVLSKRIAAKSGFDGIIRLSKNVVKRAKI
jgi:hypothetical protein